VQLGGPADALDGSVGTGKEFLTEADSAVFVPSIGLSEIPFSFACQDKLNGHTNF
jgi:hypothetical protein